MSIESHDLCFLTATEAIAKFKAKEVSPVEVMKAVIARAEAVNPKVNAFTYTFFDRALEQARAAEARYAKRAADVRPLEGVAVAIKDFHVVKGEITTFGSKAFADFRPTYTAPTVQRLLDAGAIMHARTTTPEFAYGDACHSPLWGVTRNPWNLAYSPGGSSGGAGAALAAGMTTLADGTDGGGSIRIPASACGIVGYKPPFGRNPLDRDHPREALVAYGPMTRSVADAALMQNVMSGAHIEDPCTLRERMRIPSSGELPAVKGARVAFSMDLGYLEVDPEVQRNTRQALDTWRALGCSVEDVDVGWTSEVYDAWITCWETLFAATTAHLLPRWRHELDPFVVHLLERGLTHSATRAYETNLFRGKMWEKLGPILDRYDFLVLPTTGLPSVAADHNDLDPDFSINGRRVPTYVGWVLTHGFNLMSYCPVMSVPSGFASSGVPTGMQIVARPFDDLRVFSAATAFEAAQPWRDKRPTI
jgi:Asp-tRNA(Asn)/Glu-tRNA(Gln) amidotransferase A subunit family amidase